MRAQRHRRVQGFFAATVLLAMALCGTLGACRLDPLPTSRANQVETAVTREIQRFQTKTDRNDACRALLDWRAKVTSTTDRRWIDRHVSKVLLKSNAGDLPPRCVDLVGALESTPDSFLQQILHAARKNAKPRVFAAAARALAHRQGRADLLAGAALLTQTTGDGPRSLDRLDCKTLADFFDRMSSDATTELSVLFENMGWQTTAPLRQAAWWLLVRRGCGRQAWARTTGIAALLRAAALAQTLDNGSPSVQPLRGSVATEALLVPVFARRDKKRLRIVADKVLGQSCPRDPTGRSLVVALLETLSRQDASWAGDLRNSILDHIETCGPTWQRAAAQWRRFGAKSNTSRP